MSTIRTIKNKDFTTICNTFLRDERLSWKAKGILAYLLSKPDDWKVKVSDLIKRSIDGREKVYAGVKELLEAGYMQRVEERLAGKIVGYEYVLYETGMPIPAEKPDTEKPYAVKPYAVKPDTEKPDVLINTDSIPNTDFKKILTDQRLTAPAKKDSQELSKSVGQSVSQSVSIFEKCKRQSKGIQDLIESAVKKYGYEYVISQVEYSNAKCRDLRAYRKYLSDAILKDYSSGWKDDKLFSSTLSVKQEEALEKKKRSDSDAATSRLIAEKQESERHKKEELEFNTFIESLPADTVKAYRDEFLKSCNPFIKKLIRKQGFNANISKAGFEAFIRSNYMSEVKNEQECV